MDGIFNINKPAGWTSQDVCAKLRHRLHIKKTGHTGTLDPMATGVLPVCVGKATRIIEYYDKDRKSYHAAMKLGISTDTLDITGEVLKTADWPHITEKAVREAFSAYQGVVSQVPPKYSALKIDGKRAYDLARAGKDFEIKPRQIEIFSNDITRLDLESGEIEFDVTCQKGTYVRTICDDIGNALGCGAAMSSLCRTGNGVFRIEDAVDIEEFCAMDDEALLSHVIPLDDAGLMSHMIPLETTAEPLADTALPPKSVADTLTQLGIIELDDNRVTAFLNGNSSYLTNCCMIEKPAAGNIYRVYGKTEGLLRFIGIGETEDGSLRPVKVLA